MKNRRAHILRSALTLLLCISMFVGSTFAWFTDSVTTKGNIIQAGTLELEMYWTDDIEDGEWHNVETSENKTIFDYEKWEPGYTSVRYIKLKNAGNLALNYKLAITPEGAIGKLAEVIQVYCAKNDQKIESLDDLEDMGSIGLLDTVLNGGATVDGTLLPATQTGAFNPSGEVIITLAMSMLTTAGNEYQDEDAGKFSITAIATQASHESDSFGADYDTNAEYPTLLRGGVASATVQNVDGAVAEAVSMGGDGIAAYVPAGVALEEGVETLTLQITPKESSETDITTINDEILIPLDVHVEGVAEDNEVPIIIELGEVLPKYLNMGNFLLYHVEDGEKVSMQLIDDSEEFTEHNQFKYDPYTGNVTVAMASFSEVALVANTENAWRGGYDYDLLGNGTEDDPWLIATADELAGFGRLVGGMGPETKERNSYTDQYFQLISDINLGDAEKDNAAHMFHPIGYYYDETSGDSGISSFEGTFDGNGHKISNFYQNTWEIKGDYDKGYYKDGMGLFGYVLNGAVKNLTVDHFSSDGEFTPTGVIAAYAVNSAFENIAITNCNPRVYNTGNGGIIGIAGRENDAVESIVLKNITIDKSNKISALWGSWDVACGGLVGMYRGNVDGSGNATGDTISFENCHVAAQIDVYNDVCANYQYYAYRYAGMIIGSIRHNTTNAEGKTIPNMTGISASGCTVNYGDWNDYYYCEFEENTMASYSEDYQFSRVDKKDIIFDKSGKATGCRHTHSEAEDKQAVYLPFHQLFTGYSWGVSSIGLEKYGGIAIEGDYGDIMEGDQKESVEKFESKFTGDFLYRVGNQNAVSVGSLFAAIEGKEILDEGVVVTVTKLDENMNVGGAFTADKDDWAQGSIQFNGTGVVEVTIQDYQFCTPTSIYVEVVDAKNLTTATGTTNGGNFVLLNDVNTEDYVYYYDATLYGNGFTYSLNGAPTNYDSSHGHGVIMTKNATLDNLVIVGDIYDEYGAYTHNNDYNAAIDVMGETIIENCYISGCSAPISTRANATITNTTLYGGAVANLMIKGGTVTLENVTTANYADGRDLVGMGIVVHSDATELSKLILEGTLTQYNFMSEENVPTNSYAKQLHSAMFSDGCSQYHFGTESNRYVNTGVVSLTTTFDATDITDNASTGYVGSSVSESGFDGYVYTQPNTSGSVNNDYDKTADAHIGSNHGAVPPICVFDYTSINYVAKTEGSNDYCYEENGTVKISMDEGDSFSWNTSILTVTKGNKTLDYTVSLNGTDYTGKSITFNEGGDYEVVYTYTDSDNYKLMNDEIVSYSKEYTKTVPISVSVIKETTKHAEFTMGSSNTVTEKITIGNATYISATDVTADNSTWTYIIIEGQKIYYPIVAAKLTSTKGSSSYAYFPVFENVITITDYADGGTGNEVTYNSSTTTLPSGLTAVKGIYKAASDVSYWYNLTNNSLTQSGASKIFKWASSSDAPSDPTTYNNNVLCYKSPQISADREAYITLVQYSYTDETNTTYYYYVGYTLDAFTKQTICLTPDTLVTLADGTQKEIQNVGMGEEVLAWNFHTGEYEEMPVSLLQTHGTGVQDVLHLYFEDGTELKVLGEHGIFDTDLNTFIFIDKDDARDYVGHSFAKKDGDGFAIVKLVDYEVTTEDTTAYTILSAKHYNVLANDMFTVSPAHIGDNFFNPFDIGEDMKYDQKSVWKDVQRYGLYSYEDFEDVLTYEQFEALNIAQLKVSVGKGYVTYEGLLYLIENFVNNKDLDV